MQPQPDGTGSANCFDPVPGPCAGRIAPSLGTRPAPDALNRKRRRREWRSAGCAARCSMTGASFVRIASGNWSPLGPQPRAMTRSRPRRLRLTPSRTRCRRPTRRSPTCRRRSNCGAQSGVRARPRSRWSPRSGSRSRQACTRGAPRRDIRHRSWRVLTRQRRRRGPTSRAGQRHRDAGPRSLRTTSATARAMRRAEAARRFTRPGRSAAPTGAGGTHRRTRDPTGGSP